MNGWLCRTWYNVKHIIIKNIGLHSWKVKGQGHEVSIFCKCTEVANGRPATRNSGDKF